MSVISRAWAAEQAAQLARQVEAAATREAEPVQPTVQPVDTASRSKNPMRPYTFADIIGQPTALTLMRAAVARAQNSDAPLDHTLIIGPSGTGKSTFSHVISHELGVRVFEVEAPVSFDTLMELREQMQDGDILRIEEIHQQGVMERRGRGGGTQPEVLYALMEDRVVATERGILPYPAITIIGTTTDEGRLPDAFINRFPLRPRLVRYSRDELATMAQRNAAVLGLHAERSAADMIAGACRGIPREINNLVRNCALFAHGWITRATVRKTLEVNGVTEDGLTPDMQEMLMFLRFRAARTVKGEVRYQASVNTIATAIGKSRDSKAVSLRIEPFLIEVGLVQVLPNGRLLTDAGIARAEELA